MQILLAFYSLLFVSFFSGHLIFRGNTDSPHGTILAITKAVSYGYAILLIEAYILSEFSSQGLGHWRFLLILTPLGGLCLFASKSLFRLNFAYFRNFLKVLIVMPLYIWVPLHILISNKWYFAEGVGDDGARWFMMENYLKSHKFNIWNPVETTLRFTFDGRGISLVSNALVRTLFNPPSGVATTVSYLFAVSCAGLLAGSFLINSVGKVFYRTTSGNICYFLFAFSFGSIGTICNLFFSGRLTQVFSIFPFFALIFTSIFIESFKSRVFNFAFWVSVFALSYSARYILLAAVIVMVTEVRIQSINSLKKTRLEIIVHGFVAVFVSTATALMVSFAEVRNISNLLLNDRGPDYGLFGKPIIQNILVWSGHLSTWNAVSELPKTVIAVLILAAAIIPIGILFNISLKKKQNSLKDFSIIYSVSLSFFLGLLLIGFLHSFYLVYKLSTYFPYLALVSFTMILIELVISSPKTPIKIITISSLCLLFVGSYVLVLPLQIDTYSSIISSRESSISQQLLDARNIVDATGKEKRVYGYITDPESQLLTRAVFSDNLWEPLVSSDYDFSSEIVPHPKSDSPVDWLLVRKNLKCQLVNFTSNKIVYKAKNLYIFGNQSSFVEFGSGMKSSNMDADIKLKCPGNRFEYRAVSKKGNFKFINGYRVNRILLSFKTWGAQKCEKISITRGSAKWIAQQMIGENSCVVSIFNLDLKKSYVSEFEIINDTDQDIALTAISWK